MKALKMSEPWALLHYYNDLRSFGRCFFLFVNCTINDHYFPLKWFKTNMRIEISIWWIVWEFFFSFRCFCCCRCCRAIVHAHETYSLPFVLSSSLSLLLPLIWNRMRRKSHILALIPNYIVTFAVNETHCFLLHLVNKKKIHLRHTSNSRHRRKNYMFCRFNIEWVVYGICQSKKIVFHICFVQGVRIRQRQNLKINVSFSILSLFLRLHAHFSSFESPSTVCMRVRFAMMLCALRIVLLFFYKFIASMCMPLSLKRRENKIVYKSNNPLFRLLFSLSLYVYYLCVSVGVFLFTFSIFFDFVLRLI